VQCKVGKVRVSGTTITQDEEEGVAWLRSAAISGDGQTPLRAHTQAHARARARAVARADTQPQHAHGTLDAQTRSPSMRMVPLMPRPRAAPA